MAEALNCFHVCVDCFQASVWAGGGARRAFEVQGEFIGSHWQDNMVQQFHICRRHDHFFSPCVASSTESG